MPLTEELLDEYRTIILKLLDNADNFFSEVAVEYRISYLLWMLEETPYSFWMFCKALDN